jgi:uncharacterized protein YcaQ
MHKQGIHSFPLVITTDDIYKVINELGAVQIDTVNVLERAHYLTLWSRLGVYQKELLHNLAYHERKIFEGWGHAASYMPLKDYRFFIKANKVRAQDYIVHKGWFSSTDPALMNSVLERIRNEGPVLSSNFDEAKPSKGWWGWKPTKLALEALFSSGALMVSERRNFQRVYDLTERVLPSWVDASEPTDEERIVFFCMRTMGGLGVIRPVDVRGYYHHWCVKLEKNTKQIQVILNGLVDEGKVVKVEVEGDRQLHYCLSEDFDNLERFEHASVFDDVRIFNYFDSMLWHRDRVKKLFEFVPVLEIYLKPEARRFGYFNMPILYGDELVGRLDPKLDRKEKELLVRGVWYEPWFKSDEVFENKLAACLENLAKFSKVDEVKWVI